MAIFTHIVKKYPDLLERETDQQLTIAEIIDSRLLESQTSELQQTTEQKFNSSLYSKLSVFIKLAQKEKQQFYDAKKDLADKQELERLQLKYEQERINIAQEQEELRLQIVEDQKEQERLITLAELMQDDLNPKKSKANHPQPKSSKAQSTNNQSTTKASQQHSKPKNSKEKAAQPTTKGTGKEAAKQSVPPKSNKTKVTQPPAKKVEAQTQQPTNSTTETEETSFSTTNYVVERLLQKVNLSEDLIDEIDEIFSDKYSKSVQELFCQSLLDGKNDELAKKFVTAIYSYMDSNNWDCYRAAAKQDSEVDDDENKLAKIVHIFEQFSLNGYQRINCLSNEEYIWLAHNVAQCAKARGISSARLDEKLLSLDSSKNILLRRSDEFVGKVQEIYDAQRSTSRSSQVSDLLRQEVGEVRLFRVDAANDYCPITNYKEDAKQCDSYEFFLQLKDNFLGNRLVAEVTVQGDEETKKMETYSGFVYLPQNYGTKTELDFSSLLQSNQAPETIEQDHALAKTKQSTYLTNSDEIFFSLARFESDKATASKRHDQVRFGDLTFRTVDGEDKAYTLSAFVIHSGSSLNVGHYISYILENDGQWYEYNDNVRTNVTQNNCYNGQTLEEIKQQAYYVKYSALEDGKLPKRLLPKAQEGIDNLGNTCYANAAITFLRSFTTACKYPELVPNFANIENSRMVELIDVEQPEKELGVEAEAQVTTTEAQAVTQVRTIETQTDDPLPINNQSKDRIYIGNIENNLAHGFGILRNKAQSVIEIGEFEFGNFVRGIRILENGSVVEVGETLNYRDLDNIAQASMYIIAQDRMSKYRDKDFAALKQLQEDEDVLLTALQGIETFKKYKQQHAIQNLLDAFKSSKGPEFIRAAINDYNQNSYPRDKEFLDLLKESLYENSNSPLGAIAKSQNPEILSLFINFIKDQYSSIEALQILFKLGNNNENGQNIAPNCNPQDGQPIDENATRINMVLHCISGLEGKLAETKILVADGSSRVWNETFSNSDNYENFENFLLRDDALTDSQIADYFERIDEAFKANIQTNQQNTGTLQDLCLMVAASGGTARIFTSPPQGVKPIDYQTLKQQQSQTVITVT